MKPDITPTDWDGYYARRLATSTLTRRISERLIVAMMQRHVPDGSATSVLELGGGDSCFYLAVRALFPSCRYAVIDKSREGIAKFLARHGRDNVAAIQADILRADGDASYDVVYSVGLIEHFDREGTRAVTKAHFDHARPGGIVLITFPTDRFLYGPIRWAAERLKVWAFPDERPLPYSEVEAIVRDYGEILERKTNWYIGLTQEIVIARKAP
jgi:cyclopropane fatty-acyl-phospholipid synthase-like methyltransferase